MTMKKILNANGVDLCAETLGDPGDPALLLIMGSSAPMDWWEDGLCTQLADGGRHVIRYDHRDTGESVSYPAGEPGYTGADLAADAMGILDALGIERAHVAGMSMGGALAQSIALEHPRRVLALTLIATTPVAGGPDDLPGMDDEARAAFAAIAEPDWGDRDAVVDYMTALAAAGAARTKPFDDARFRPLAARVFDRTRNFEASMRNHHAASRGRPPAGGVGDIRAPTLVVHGDQDPIFPLAHGLALADTIRGAGLLVLDDAGHELPPHTWEPLAQAILAQPL
jgi:pimeloyl-ACP methyl ester carboxylesterase